MKNRFLFLLVLPAIAFMGCDLLNPPVPGHLLPPTVVLSAAKETVKSGESLLIQATLTHDGTDSVAVSWKVNGVVQPDATGTSFEFSAHAAATSAFTITAIATCTAYSVSSEIAITVLDTVFNPLAGRWVMDAGTVSLSYWFYDDLTLHRESSFGESSAGYYSFTPAEVAFHFVGSTLDETCTYAVQGDTMTLTATDGGLTLVFAKAATLSPPENMAPQITISGGDKNLKYGVEANISASATDADVSDTLKYEWYVDGTRLAGETSATLRFSRKPDAMRAYSVKAVVSDGKTPVSSLITVTVDITLPGVPSVLLSSPCGAYTNLSPISFTAAFSEDVTALAASGIIVTGGVVDSFEAGSSPSSYEFSVTPAGEGQIVVSIPAGIVFSLSDNKENTASNEVSITYDTTIPTISLDQPAPGSRVHSNSLLVLSGSDIQSPCASLDGISWTPVTTGVTALGTIPGFDSLSADQSFTLYLKDTDRAGNVGTGTANLIRDMTGSMAITIVLVTPTDADISFGSFDSTLSKSLGEFLSVTATLPGATAFSWYLDGELIGSSSVVTVSSSDIAPGPCTLALIVYKDGVPYSAELKFNVIN